MLLLAILMEETITRNKINNNGESAIILNQWIDTLRSSLSKIADYNLKGIGFAMPGPFNYEDGICLMKGVNKYDALYNINIAQHYPGAIEFGRRFPLKI